LGVPFKIAILAHAAKATDASVLKVERPGMRQLAWDCDALPMFRQ
jgi:hypothetical protein